VVAWPPARRAGRSASTFDDAALAEDLRITNSVMAPI
jgi:hypothetical protein